MKIRIYRGENQIGGNIIEIATESTKILLDIGLDLDDDKNRELPAIEGLFDRKGYDAVFISHYHGDHMGLAYNIIQEIPIYMGEASYKIIKASDEYKAVKTFMPYGFLKNVKLIIVGDIKITPFLCDHSAFDSYMLFIAADGENILYTGDFRSNGRKSFDRFLKELPVNIDTLICEGTTLSRDGYVSEAESELETKTVEIIKSTDAPVFVLQSSMNIDRIVTMYRAAKRCKRIFLQDLYMAEITKSIGGSIPNPIGFSDVKTFITRPYNKEHFRYRLFDKYGSKKISKQQITKSKFVMCIRTSMLQYLKSLSEKMSFENGVLIYSFWSGYKEQPEMRNFIKECEQLGLKVTTLHTSGHADEGTILKLIDKVKPKTIMPIHTENAEWFEKREKNKYKE
jgi:ribonuclease J